MKIKSYYGKTKTDKNEMRRNFLAADGKSVRYNGSTFQVVVQVLSNTVLASASSGRILVDLFDRTSVAKDLRKLCENRLYS